MNDPGSELDRLCERIERMAGEVSAAVDRDFDHAITPEEPQPSLDKLRVLLNHLIATARQGRDECVAENRRLQRKIEQLKSSPPQLPVPLTAQDVPRRAFSILADSTHKLRELTAAFLESLGRHEPDDPPSTSRSARRTRKEGLKLLRILHDLHDLAAIEAGELKPERIPCSHIELLESIRRALAPGAECRGIGLRVSYETAVPEVVWSDPTRLAQILECVIAAALAATERGEVHVLVRHEEQGEAPSLSFVVSGGSAGAEGARDALEQTFRAARRGLVGELAVGLEPVLAIKFAALLGGSLTVLRGEGPSFSIDLTIPGGNAGRSRQVEPAEALAGPEDVSARFDRPLDCRILVAEDDPDTRKLLESALRIAGARVDLIADGKRAVDLVLEAEKAGEPFDVVFLDLQLPGECGPEVSRELRSRGFDRTIIALTDRALKEKREESLEAGCDAFIARPYEASMFKLLVRSCLAGRSREDVRPA